MSYCTTTDINSLFGDISDDVTLELLELSQANGEAWIEANLKKHYLPIPTNNPKALKTANIYYSASDILLSLYHGDELPVQYDVWFNKAQSLLDDYIESEVANGEDDNINPVELQMVKHSHALTYREKRKCNRWAR